MKDKENKIRKLISAVICLVIFGSAFVISENMIAKADENEEELTLSTGENENGFYYAIPLRSRTIKPMPGISEELLGKKLPDRLHGLIQFYELPDISEREYLANLGVSLLGYLPYYAWMASLPSERLEEIISHTNVRWIGKFQPEDKVSPSILGDKLSDYIINLDGTLNLVVTIFEDVPQDEARGTLNRYGVVYEEPILSNFWLVNIPKDNIWALASEDSVQWVEGVPPPLVEANDGSRECIGIDWVNLAPYDLHGDSDPRAVTIGEWDSGHVDSTHPDFAGRVVFGDVSPMSNHATWVAGVAIGDGTNSVANGGTPFQWRGMADQTRIVSYEWPNSINEMDIETRDAIDNHGAVISQNSWVFMATYGSYHQWSQNYDDIVTGKLGTPISVVFAAGNDQQFVTGGYGSIMAPGGTAKNTIAVGAINSDDDSMTFFSSWGPTDDGRTKPDLVAAGDEVGGDGGIVTTHPGGGYTNGPPGFPNEPVIGTSFAAPAVSGTAALIYEEYRATHRGFEPLPSTVKGTLIHTADDLGNVGPDYQFGWGKVNAPRAIDLVREDAVGQKSILEGIINSPQAEIQNHRIQLPPGTIELKVTLVWDDEPGNPLDNPLLPELVNNLDLTVQQGVATHFPWVLDPNNPANPAGTGVDNLNNVEQVLVTDINGLPETDWIISVRSTIIPVIPQTYSLIISYKIPRPDVEIRDDDGERDASIGLNSGSDEIWKYLVVGSGSLSRATSAKLWICGQGQEDIGDGDTIYLEVNDNPDWSFTFNPCDIFDPVNYEWRSFDIPLSWFSEGATNEIYLDYLGSWGDHRYLGVGIDLDHDYGRSIIKDQSNPDHPGELMIYLEIVAGEVTGGTIIRDDDGELNGQLELNSLEDSVTKFIYIGPEALDGATSVKLWIYGMSQSPAQIDDRTIELFVNINSFGDFNPCLEFGTSSYNWACFDIPVVWLIPGVLNSFTLDRIMNDATNNDLAIGVDQDHDYGRSILLNEVYTDPGNDYPGEAMIYLQITDGKVFRDDDGTMEGLFGLNSMWDSPTGDQATKYIIISCNGLIGIQSARIWIYGIGQYPSGPQATIRLQVNGYTWGDFNPCDIFSTTDYEWHSFDINPSWLIEGGENEIFLDRIRGYSSGNYLGLCVDRDHDYGRTILLNEYYQDPENDYPGEAMIYLQINDAVFIRLDDNERDSWVMLNYPDDIAIKTLTINDPIPNIDSATLWIYGRAQAPDGRTADSHRLRLNSQNSQSMYINPYVDFTEPVSHETWENWYTWVSFDIPLSWLNQGSNAFEIKDIYSHWTQRNLYIGIDTDSNYGASYISMDHVNLDGELMIYLKLTLST
jgi:hypothetical protein